MDECCEEMPGWCQHIRVRNTFIDVDDVCDSAAMRAPRRERSAPPGVFTCGATAARAEGANAAAAAEQWIALRRSVLRGGGRSTCRRKTSRFGRTAGRRQSGGCYGSGQSSGRSSSRSSVRSGSRSSCRSESGSRCSNQRSGVRTGDCSSGRSNSSDSCRAASTALAAQACLALDASGFVAICRGTPPIAQWNNLSGHAAPTDFSAERCHTYDALSVAIREPENDAIEDRTALHTVAEDDFTELDIDSEDDIDCSFADDPKPGYAIDTSNRFGALEHDETGATTQSPCKSPRELDALSLVAELALFEVSDLSASQNKGMQSALPEFCAQHAPPSLLAPPAEGPAVAADNSATRGPAARKKKKRASGRTAQAPPSGPPRRCSSDQSPPEIAADQRTEMRELAGGAGHIVRRKPLVGDKAEALALLTVRLNQQVVKSHLRAACAREMVLATPVDPGQADCADMLELNLGTVVHCEATDSSGWGFGTIVAPARLAGQRGCFSCEGMWPVIAELRASAGAGDTLECSPGSWSRVGQMIPPTTQGRLRQKAMLSRLSVARSACDKRRA